MIEIQMLYKQRDLKFKQNIAIVFADILYVLYCIEYNEMVSRGIHNCNCFFFD